jgi:hypothetical protein
VLASDQSGCLLNDLGTLERSEGGRPSYINAHEHVRPMSDRSIGSVIRPAVAGASRVFSAPMRRVDTSEPDDDLETQKALEIWMAILKSRQTTPSLGPFASVVARFRRWCERRRGYKLTLRHDRAVPPVRDLPPIPDWCDLPEPSSETFMPIRRRSPTPIRKPRSILRSVTTDMLYASYRLVLEDRIRMEDPEAYAAAKGIGLGTLRRRIARMLVFVRAELRARRRSSRP